ncbi:MAG: PhzF family phenazine biosynthesis protein [Lawsonibacter sp.]|nr:PhzF family phenazine biosynthesis protein [Lawsonibacter sp.]
MQQYVVDAFAGRLFEGNPAAVCLLDQWPEDRLMFQIASENALPETAFAVPEGEGWRLRWFAPGDEEVDLCGHATLAAAYVITRFAEPSLERVVFHTRSGPLPVERKGDLLEMDFPAYTLKRLEVTDQLTAALGVRPLEVWRARDLLCVLEREEDVVNLRPDLEAMQQLPGALCHVTARGRVYDTVSRTFGPKCAIPEDPVCGSGHCHIIPYWAARTGQTEFTARQASPRGGTLYCRLEGDRVKLAGRAFLYARAELMVEGLE